MKRNTKFALVAVLSANALWPRPLLAMDVQQFANMATKDQRDYLAFLVSEAQEVLIRGGERDEAKKVERLFRDISQGGDRSVGEAQFESLVASTLHYMTNVPGPLKGTMRASVASHPASGHPKPRLLSKTGLRPDYVEVSPSWHRWVWENGLAWAVWTLAGQRWVLRLRRRPRG